MRTFEILILATILLRLIILLFTSSKKWPRIDWLPSVATLCVIVHFVLEGYRWQMEPAYVLALVLFVLSLSRIMPRPDAEDKHSSRKLRALGIVGTFLGILCFAYVMKLAPRWQTVPAYVLALLLFVFSVPKIRPNVLTEAKQPSRRWRAFRTIGIVLGLLYFVFAAGLPAVLPIFRLPKPTGPHPVGTMHLHLVDRTRPETFTSDESDYRELMVQVWYPAEPQSGTKPAAYLENAEVFSPIFVKIARQRTPLGFLLPSCTFEHLALVKTHAYPDAPLSRAQFVYPVLLYSHGAFSFLGQNTIQMEELASHGYIVFSVGHTYETAVTIFPDGRIVRADPAILDYFAETRRLQNTVSHWPDDMHFVMDELERINARQGSTIFAGKLDMARLGVFGMSYGGRTAFEVFSRDARCKAGISLDGGGKFRGRLRKPFLFFFAEESRQHIPLYLGAGNLGHLALVEGTTHTNFTDFSLLSPVSKRGFIGRIDGKRMCRILNEYTLAFFDKYLKGKDVHLLNGPSPDYPEVKFPRI